jgi:hypothetical protein
LLREPLLHFLLAGFALFLAYRGLNPGAAARDASNQIRLTESRSRSACCTASASPAR